MKSSQCCSSKLISGAPATEPPRPRPLSAPDGLYSATDVEQRGRNLPKLMCSMAGHCASGATPPMNCTPARSTYSS